MCHKYFSTVVCCIILLLRLKESNLRETASVSKYVIAAEILNEQSDIQQSAMESDSVIHVYLLLTVITNCKGNSVMVN